MLSNARNERYLVQMLITGSSVLFRGILEPKGDILTLGSDHVTPLYTLYFGGSN